MEPTEGKPAQRRRRWVIVAFVFLLVSMCSWWQWPRGDARFVGKWEFHPSPISTQAFFTLDLKSSGWAILQAVKAPKKPRSYAQWSFTGNSLIVGNPAKQPVSRWMTAVTQFFRKHASANLMTDTGLELIIHTISVDEIGVDMPGSELSIKRFTLRRVRE